MAELTPFQTVGPFLSLGLRVGVGDELSRRDGTDRIVITGRLRDGAGTGIPDGVLEWWHPGWRVIHRTLTDDEGRFTVTIDRPGPVPGPDAREQAPHVAVRVLGRGILTQYLTRMYLADDPRNAADDVLNLVPEQRRHTLIASATAPNEYRFDVVVQGADETVFFDL